MKRIIKDITEFIFIEDIPKKADVIFIPGSANPFLPKRAAKFLVPSGGVSLRFSTFPGVTDKKEIYNKEYKTESEFYEDVLLQNFVPKSAIFLENKASYTRENAKCS